MNFVNGVFNKNKLRFNFLKSAPSAMRERLLCDVKHHHVHLAQGVAGADNFPFQPQT